MVKQMSGFSDEFQKIKNDRWMIDVILNATEEKVLGILNKEVLSFMDFLSLLSPSAEKFLDRMASRSRSVTLKHFGKNLQLYAPLYLSNECNNSCGYCGFNKNNSIERKTLTIDEIKSEMAYLKSLGFQNILLLTGDAPQKTDIDYLVQAVKLAKESFAFVGIEVYPLSVESYKKLIDAGASGLTIYQETYDEETYKRFHTAGDKSDFYWRLETPERGLKAGFRKVGIGALLGLYEWRFDIACLGFHAAYLMKKYWKSELSVSFPRLRGSKSNFTPPYNIPDKNFVQMIFAMRIFLPQVGITLSTREPAVIRDNLIGFGVTMMSAASKTNPGGYTNIKSEEQFSIADERSVSEVVEVIRKKGIYPVFKDWDSNFAGVTG